MPIYKKINEVMKAVKGVEKVRMNTHGKFKYAGHEDVNEALRGEFARVGIVPVARMVSCQILDGGTLFCECLITYVDIEDESKVEIPIFAVQPSQTSGKTVTAQQIGQALSYASKNAAFKCFALTGDNEPDSDSSVAYNPQSGGDHPDASPTHDKAHALLRGFETAKTEAEVETVTKALKAEWPNIKGVAGLADEIVKRKAAALSRLKGA